LTFESRIWNSKSRILLYPEMSSHIQKHLRVRYAIQQQVTQTVKKAKH